jgi:hypothetical protein
MLSSITLAISRLAISRLAISRLAGIGQLGAGLAIIRLAGTGLAITWLAGIWLGRSGAGRIRLGGAGERGTRLGAAPRSAARGSAARGRIRCHPALLRWRSRLLLVWLPVSGLGDTGSGRSGRYDVPRHLCSSRPPKHIVYRRTIRYVPGSAR